MIGRSFSFLFLFCSEAGVVTIEGPLRRKTLLKEGRKPKVEPPGTLRFSRQVISDLIIITHIDPFCHVVH